MGNHSTKAGDIDYLNSPSPTTPSLSRHTSPSPYAFNETSKQHRKIYKEILKDIKKLRIKDDNNRYNPHRRQRSILNNLPQNLKKYSGTIHTVNEFWLNHIQCLSSNTLNEMAMLLYCHLYCQCTPNARKILLQSNKMNVPSHTLKVFTIFEYVIRQITDTNTENHTKLFKQLKMLGIVHSKYLNINSCDAYSDSGNNIYELLLDSFNYVMEQTFNDLFTLRVRFCFSQLYRVIVDIMNNNDLISLVQNRSMSRTMICTNDINSNTVDASFLKQIDGFLGSFEDCLSHEIGSVYFKKYLQEQFCAENYLFYEAVEKYKLAKHNQRIKIGKYIIDTFIKKRSEKQINVSSSTRNKILTVISLAKKMNNNKAKYANMVSLANDKSQTTTKILQITKNNSNSVGDMIYSVGFTVNLFDAAYEEIFYLMKTNSWISFRNTILGYCNNDSFVKKQQIKLTEHKQEQSEKRKLIKNVNNLKFKVKQKRNNKFKLKVKTNSKNKLKINKKNKKDIKIIIATPSSIENDYMNDMNNTSNDVIDYGDTDSEYEQETANKSINCSSNNDKKRVQISTPVLSNSTTSLKLMGNDRIDSNASNVSYSATLTLPTLSFSQTSLKNDISSV